MSGVDTLVGKVAIVTGASRGIGAAIAATLASRGANVVVDYLSNDERAADTVEAINQHSTGSAIAVKADVRDEAATQALAQAALSAFGGIDILVNNALSHYSFDPHQRSTFANLDWSCYRDQFEGCIHGAYNTCKAVLPAMREQTGGRIINISSNLVDAPIVPYHDYNTAKGALDGMTRTLAQELGAWGITMNAVAAGLTIGTDSSRATPEDVREQIIGMTPLGRLATADDIACAVAMLASDDASFITGQIIHVDGGLVMR